MDWGQVLALPDEAVQDSGAHGVHRPGLGALVNTVGLATEAPEWTFGAAALMRNLAGRGLLA